MSKIGKGLTLLLIVSLLSATGVAQELPSGYRAQNIPLGIFKEGENLRCFNFEDTKQLLLIDYQYTILQQKLSTMLFILSTSESARRATEQQYKLEIENSKLLENELDRMTKKWKDTDLAYQKADASRNFWKSWVLWGAGGSLLVGVVAGVIIHGAIN